MSKQLKVDLIANTSQFKRAMSETSNQMKLINSEFKSAAAETDQYGNKLDATGAKKKQLSGVIDQYKTRIEAIKNEQKHWTAELEKGNITEEQHAQKQQELARRLNNTEAQMKNYEGQLKRLNAEGKNARMTFDEFDKKFRDVGKTMRDTGVKVGIAAGVGFTAMKRVLGDVVGEAKDFYFQMSEVQAISGATGEEFEKLTKQSKDLGKATKFTAQEAAESQANLARAGFNTNEILGAMPGLLDLAASSNLDLGTSANITSNIIRTFNFDAKEAARVADVLAKGAATANTDVQGLGQAMEVAGPVANSLNIALEEVAASAGIMADAGIDGSKSGRMLRQGMLRLAKPTGEAAKQLKKMKVEAFDADGNMKSLDKVVEELEKGLKGQTKQQKAAALATIFGSESTAGWTVLLDKGSAALKDYTVELENSEGAAKDMADVMQDNAEGAIIRMQSAISGMKIELGEKLLPVLSRGANFVGDLANSISDLDEETITTIAHTALLVTGVLGVTTAVAGLVAGVGALMAFAGPVGLAIVGGTALLAGLAAVIYKNKLETEALAEEQAKAKEDAIRYGEGLSEGTKKGVQGYVDLYEGAKLKMHELKNMSGDEAKATVKEIQKAFQEMGTTVIAELEKQRDELSRVIQEVYAIAGEYGEKAADELSSNVVERFQEDITEYEKAVSTITEIIEEYGSDVSKYPKTVQEAYNEAIMIMDEGSTAFAKTHDEMINIQKRISESENTILAKEQEEYINRINKTYADSVDAVNTWYYDKTSVIDQALAQDKITAEEHQNLMAGVEAATNEMYSKAATERDNALKILAEHADTRGKLIDFETGKEFERAKVFEENSVKYGAGMKQRTQTDEEYLASWIEHTKNTLKSQEDFNEKSKGRYIQQLEAFIESMGYSKEEATKITRELVDESLAELDKGDDKAEASGVKKMDAYSGGMHSAKKRLNDMASDVNDEVLKQLDSKKEQAEQAGKNKVSGYNSGIRQKRDDTETEAKGVASSAEKGLRSVSASGAGSDFVSGFTSSIRDRTGTGSSVWSAAWSLGSTALTALRGSIRTASPSKETGITGKDFTLGFTNSIDDGKKQAINSAKLLGKESLNALNDEVKGYKNSFGALSATLESNREALKVEHTLDGKFKELLSVFNVNRNEEDGFMRQLLQATLEQNKLLMQLLNKSSDVYINDRLAGGLLEPVITEIQDRNNNINSAFR